MVNDDLTSFVWLWFFYFDFFSLIENYSKTSFYLVPLVTQRFRLQLFFICFEFSLAFFCKLLRFRLAIEVILCSDHVLLGITRHAEKKARPIAVYFIKN